jgi:TolB-like protein
MALKAILESSMRQKMGQFFGLIFWVVAVSAAASPLTMAVLDFENRSFMNAEKYAVLSQGLAEMMITELSQVEEVQMVERRRLRELLDELKLSQSGMISESGSVQVGKMLGAKNMVFGSYVVMPGEKIRVDLRIVEVETGSVVKAEEQTGKTKDILTLVKKLSKQLLSDLSIRLSHQESARLDEKKTIKLNAVMVFSEGLSLEDENRLSEAYTKYKEALQIEPDFQQAHDAIQRIAEKKRLNTN